MTADRKDVVSGGLFIVVGLTFGTWAYITMTIGSALNMGAAFFPLVLAVTLVTLGAIIAFRGLMAEKPRTLVDTLPVRPLLMISLAVSTFAWFLEDLGLFAASFLATILASFATENVRPARALVASFAIAAFCALVFGYGLRISVPVFGPLLGGRG